MSSDAVISVENLSKCYQIYSHPRDRLKQFIQPPLRRLAGLSDKQYHREFWALRDVSFTVGRGETVGIIGHNGSGKSTLLQIICGTVSPTTGTVQTRGRVAALLELGAGFNPEFTGRENVMLNAAILGVPSQEMAARMEEVLAFSELGDFLDQPVKTYSSGMHARLAFSTAIHVNPEILIVDEALSVGDARFVAKCMRRIKTLKSQGTTILFVSHDVGSVRTLCERVIWLNGGRMIEQGDVFPVTGRYMEFMFRDIDTPEKIVRDEIAMQSKEASSQEPGTADSLQIATGPAMEGDGISTPGSGKTGELLDSRPVTHWGSDKGIIISASVQDTGGTRSDVHAWDSEIKIVIAVCIPTRISRDHLSIAFSIKDLKGTDLIVSTTHDFEKRRLPDSESFEVSFRLKNPLITGKYLLVAAVENRNHTDIHYYEYVEGAHYFSSLCDERLFGLFQPSIEQQVRISANDNSKAN